MQRNRKVAVVDYGLGNLFSISRALEYIGVKCTITTDHSTIEESDGLILPGVGAFGDGITRLKVQGLNNAICEYVKSGKRLLGICLGMQLLFGQSEEFGHYPGLNLIDGDVSRLKEKDTSGRPIKIPHVGWSGLQKLDGSSWDGTILTGLTEGDAVYFVHSYIPSPGSESVSIAQINYGNHLYCAAVEQDNVAGVQFHPEKSGEIGLQILRNFAKSL